MDKLKLQRYQVASIMDELEQEEQIYHEGLGRASKYIHMSVDANEVDDILNDNTSETKISNCIDELSEFLYSEELTTVSIGFNKDDRFLIKFLKNGSIIHDPYYENIESGINAIRKMMVITNG